MSAGHLCKWTQDRRWWLWCAPACGKHRQVLSL